MANAGLIFGGGVIEDIINAILLGRGNQATRENIEEGNQILGNADVQNYDTLNPYRQQDYVFNAGQTAQGGQYPTDLKSYFSDPRTAKGTWDESYNPYDFKGLEGRITDVLKGGTMNPDQAAGAVGHFYDQAPIDTRAYVANKLNESSGASMQRSSKVRSDILSRGLASGKSLQELTGDIDTLGYSEGIARGGDASIANAQAEADRNKAALEKAGSQTQAFNVYGGYGAELAKSLGSELSTIGKNTSDAALESAKARTSAGTFDISEEDRRKQAMLDELGKLRMEGMDSAKFSEIVASLMAKMHADTASQQASSISGQNLLVPQTNAFGDLIQYLTTVSAARAGKPDSGSPFQSALNFTV